jgi:uroporphyrinogen decarboxylase
MRQDPEKVKRGLDVITESTLLFVRECIQRGVDGFYHSTEGGEADRLEGPVFDQHIKPSDLTVMKEMNDNTPFNILHVCDLMGDYTDLTPYVEYPGDIVNCPLRTRKQAFSPREASQLFGRPYMGGLRRDGAISQGTPEAMRKEVQAVMRDVPDGFILGADCTVPGDTPWENIKAAIDAAHSLRR